MWKKGKVFVISGPSGVGKGTICAKLKEKHEMLAAHTVSVTTRPPRIGEVEGVNYYFRSKEQFQKLLDDGMFLETATVYQNSYGTLYSEVERVLKSGKNVILEIDTQGALNVKAHNDKVVLIFIMSTSLEILKSRIISRGSETEESLLTRHSAAIKEINECNCYDYLVINDVLDVAVEQLKSIIVAEGLKVADNKEYIKKLLGGNK